MTITMLELVLYAGALFILFLTPGPVWVGIIARSLSGGFHAAWPLALGVVVGDIVWPLIAILGVTWLVDQISWFMDLLKWVAVIVFVVMGGALIRNANKQLSENSSLTRPGMWAGFLAGVAVILANPKAVLFYMGVLPGFFDLTRINWSDIVAICVLSMLIPLLGNLAVAAFVGHARGMLKSPTALRRITLVSGSLLIGVGLVIAMS